MEAQAPLPHSQEHATCPYPEHPHKWTTRKFSKLLRRFRVECLRRQHVNREQRPQRERVTVWRLTRTVPGLL